MKYPHSDGWLTHHIGLYGWPFGPGRNLGALLRGASGKCPDYRGVVLVLGKSRNHETLSAFWPTVGGTRLWNNPGGCEGTFACE